MSTEPRVPSEDRIERLLRFAGPRPEVPAERAERVRDQVMESWRLGLKRRFQRRLAFWSTLAAAAAMTVAVLLPGVREQVRGYVEPAVQGPVARVEAVSGAARFGERHSEPSERGRLLMVGDVIRAGSTVETAARGRVALRLESGPSVRLDVESTVRFVAPGDIGLDRGRVYVDSGSSESPVEVRTAAGTVVDIGTQFEVRSQPLGVRVRVRDGLIQLARSGEAFEAAAGTELEVEEGGAVVRREVPVYGPIWDWVLEVAPPFELEGRSLAEFLSWVDQETGWEVRFVERRAEVSAGSVVLHGSLDGLRPDRALDAVLPTCGLTHRLDSGRLYIEALPQ